MASEHSLRWIHLSDLHFGHGDAHYRFDQVGVTNAVVHSIKETAGHLGPPDVIFITGDVAFSGQPGQYAQAKEWLDRVLRVVGGSPRLFMVPGNHDVDRRLAGKFSAAAVHRELRADPTKLDELLQNSEEMQSIWPKLSAYSEFTKRFDHPAQTAETPFYSQEIPCALGGRLVIVGLNTALLSFDSDDFPKNLCLGRGQILKAIEQQPRDALLLVLQHHPQEWLLDGKDLAAHLQQRAHIQFSGHVHQQQGVVHVPLLGGSRLQFVAGAGHQDRDEQGYHAYAWGQLSEEGLAYYSWVWNPERHGFALASLLDTDDFKHGDHVFVERARLPKSLQNWLPKLSSASTQSLSLRGEQNSFTERKEFPPPASEPSTPALSKANYSPENPAYYIPYPAKGKRLIGRQREMEEIQRRFQDSIHKHPGRLVLIGIGGLGKTQLAAEYCHRHRAGYPGGIYWFDAGVDLEGQLTSLSDSARWLSPDSKHNEKLDVARHRLRSQNNCLLVFDNVEALTTIQAYLPTPDNNSHTLILSRFEQPGFQPIELELLSLNESIQLLESESERRLVREEDLAAAGSIARQLDGLPLAIELVGAHMRRRSTIAWAEYAQGLDQKGVDARALNWSGFNDESLTRHGADLRAALGLEAHFFQDNAFLRPLLDLLTWAGGSSMGESLLREILGKPDDVDLSDALELSVQLRILSVEQDGPQRRFRMHRLVQQVRRLDVHPPQGDELITDVTRLGDWFLARRHDPTFRPVFEAELEHLRTYRAYAETAKEWETVVRLLWLEAYPPYYRGQYPLALSIIRESLTLYQMHAVDNLILEADLESDLGAIFMALGQAQAAMEPTQKSLSLRQKVLDENNPAIALSLNNLGVIAHDLGQYQKSLHLKEQALEIWRKGLGDSHPDTARAYLNLGESYSYLGRHQEALKFQHQALEIWRQALDANHPNIATALHNLGSIYSALGQHQQALELEEKALAIRRRVLGDQHPDTARALSNIGSTYDALGQHQTALRFKREALAIWREVLGDKHPDAALALGNLGATYNALGQHLEALQVEQQALAIRREVLGDKHPDSVRALSNLGATYEALKQFPDALKLYQQVLIIRREILGDKHPETALSLSNLGRAYHDLGQDQQALKCYQEALAIRREVLGDKHPDTAKALNNLGSTYYALREYGPALSHAKASVSIYLDALGTQHPDTSQSCVNLALCWVALQQRIEALKVVRAGLRGLSAEHSGYAMLKKLEGQLLDVRVGLIQKGWRLPPKKPPKERPRR